MNWKLGASAIAVATLLAGAAQAANTDMTLVNHTAFDNTSGTPTFTFDTGTPLVSALGSFTGGALRTGTTGDSAAPAGDSTQYLSVLGGSSATFTANPGVEITEMQIYIGSLDTYNSIQVSGFDALGGFDLLPPANGGQSSGATNQWFDIKFNTPMTSITFSSNQNSFEFDNVNFITAGVPEPGVWTMMIAGFGLLGMALRSSKLATRFASL
jgi:hypothetical protein